MTVRKMHKQLLKLTTVKQITSFVKNWALLALWLLFFPHFTPIMTFAYSCFMFVQSFGWDYVWSIIQVEYLKKGEENVMQ